jgi:hypothetical protein
MSAMTTILTMTTMTAMKEKKKKHSTPQHTTIRYKWEHVTFIYQERFVSRKVI